MATGPSPRIVVRLDPAELRKVKAAAKRAKSTVSDIVRQAINTAMQADQSAQSRA